jgi:hypothetical protein
LKPFFIVIAVASLLVFAAQPRAESSGAGQAAPRAGRPQMPPGWLELTAKTLDLTLEGKHLAVFAMYEQWVAKHPDFVEGHLMLAGAHESVARDMRTSRAPDAQATRTKHLETAAVHIRRGLELADPDDSFWIMRSLIDLYGLFGLDRPAEYERLVRESVQRYPAEPLAHAALLKVLATKGEPIEAAARAARAAIPKGPDARVALAGSLVRSARDFGRLTPALPTVLLPEASRLIDEALKLKPGDARALDVRASIHELQTNSSQLPLTHDDGVRNALTAIVSAQAGYAAACGHGFYAPTLAALARPEQGRRLGFLYGDDLVPPKGATVLERFRYRIEMTAVPSPKSAASCNGVPAGGSAESFSVVARPLEGFHGRAYRIDADGKLTDIK